VSILLTPYLYIFQVAKNYPADFVVFILPEVNMIGSRVTVDDASERKQLGAFGKIKLLLFFLASVFCH